MRDRRLEVPYEDQEDAQAREDRELGIPWYVFGAQRRAMRNALREAKPAKKVAQSAPPKKVAAETPAKTTPRPSVTPRVGPGRAKGMVTPTQPELNALSARPRDVVQYDSGTLNPSEFGPARMGPAAVERGTISTQGREQNYEAMFPAETFNPGVSPDSVFVPPSRRGLFGEEISQEDYDAMTRRNKEATPFYGQFLKKGGQVKKKLVKSTKKYASGGSVSSASKRGDGCAQRGKTKGRMV